MAQTVCNDIGGRLPTIASAEENSFVFNMFKYCPNTNVGYLGLDDMVKEGQFRWMDDTKSSYTNWNSGQPDNAGPPGSEEDCGNMYIFNAPGKWTDISCNTKYSNCFVCEDSK